MKLSEEEDIEIKIEDMSTLDDLQAYSNFQTKEKDPPIEKVRFCLTSLRTIIFHFAIFLLFSKFRNLHSTTNY